ncbi:MAG: ABC transporter ATP-binding protein [Gemmatimonadota bacterium]|nr:ABC transporter ATP-binding protein [Gemmatimonadota bacterium]
MSGKVVISARGLKKTFGSFTAVDKIDFEVYAGECFGILGPNEAGKTSTMHMLYGFSPRKAGKLEVFGLDPARDGIRLRQVVGVVQQTNNLDLELTVRENLEVYGGYFGLNGRKLKERISELLDFMELTQKADARIKHLSGGMKRRLTIVRALVHEPKLVIMDEPSTGLDPQARLQIWAVMRKLVGQGVTVVLTTHYMEEAERLCDRLIIMDRGKIIHSGKPRALIERHLKRLILEVDRRDLGQDWQQAGLEYECHDDRVLFMADREADFERLSCWMANSKRILRPANLEDLFLKLTGRTLVD